MAAKVALPEAGTVGGGAVGAAGCGAGVLIGPMGFCGTAIWGGLVGSIGVAVGDVMVGGRACVDPIGIPGAGFGIFPALSGNAWGEVPSALIDAVPAGGLAM